MITCIEFLRLGQRKAFRTQQKSIPSTKWHLIPFKKVCQVKNRVISEKGFTTHKSRNMESYNPLNATRGLKKFATKGSG